MKTMDYKLFKQHISSYLVYFYIHTFIQILLYFFTVIFEHSPLNYLTFI